MWDTCKGWWEGKIKVEVDEVRFLHRSRGDRHCCRWVSDPPKLFLVPAKDGGAPPDPDDEAGGAVAPTSRGHTNGLRSTSRSIRHLTSTLPVDLSSL
jgi:hypothetical protein